MSDTIRFRPRGGLRRTAVALAAVIVLGLAGVRPAQAEADDPAQFVRDFGDRALAVLADGSLSGPAREQAFRGLLSEGFDIPTIGRFVLGRYVRKATEAERAEFAGLFEDLIVASYSRQLTNYSGETLAVEGVRQQDERSATVASRILRAEGEPIGVDWRLLRRDQGWRIVDVVVEGVSMALTQRSEFAAVIRAEGGRVAGLLDRLRAKMRQAESAETKTAEGTL